MFIWAEVTSSTNKSNCYRIIQSIVHTHTRNCYTIDHWFSFRTNNQPLVNTFFFITFTQTTFNIFQIDLKMPHIIAVYAYVYVSFKITGFCNTYLQIFYLLVKCGMLFTSSLHYRTVKKLQHFTIYGFATREDLIIMFYATQIFHQTPFYREKIISHTSGVLKNSPSLYLQLISKYFPLICWYKLHVWLILNKRSCFYYKWHKI